MLNSRAIALQGVGFSPAQLAVQGFLNVEVTPPIPELRPAYDDVGGPEGSAPKREVWMTMKILADEREFVELLPMILKVLQ